MKIKFISKMNFGYNGLVRFLPVGTIAYMKCKDNSVRACKIIAFCANGHGCDYSFKVAGLEDIVVGDFSTPFGAIYPTKDIAIKSPSDHYSSLYVGDNGWSGFFNEFDLRQFIMNKYRLDKSCIRICDFVLRIFPIKLNSDGTMSNIFDSKFSFYCDEHGTFHFDIPSIDNGELYGNEKEAMKHYTPTIIDFDIDDNSEEENIVSNNEDIFTFTINITSEQLSKIKELGIDIK